MAVTVPEDDGWRLPDELWEALLPHLPAGKPHPWGCHNPRVSDRSAMEAILFVLRTGCQWEALNYTTFCKKSSAHRRFQEWEAAGVFAKLWELGLQHYDAVVGIDWRWQALDGAMTKAPLGGKKNRTKSHGSGQNRHETQLTDRPAGRSDGPRGRRSERERLQAGAGNPGEYARRAA
jgi:transposase